MEAEVVAAVARTDGAPQRTPAGARWGGARGSTSADAATRSELSIGEDRPVLFLYILTNLGTYCNTVCTAINTAGTLILIGQTKTWLTCDQCRSEHSLTGARKEVTALPCTLDSIQHRELGWVGSQRRQHRAHCGAYKRGATSHTEKQNSGQQRFDKVRPLLQTLLSVLVCSNVLCRQSSNMSMIFLSNKEFS